MDVILTAIFCVVLQRLIRDIKAGIMASLLIECRSLICSPIC
jgi:hypothetical protein